jgi:hypothetical protein
MEMKEGRSVPISQMLLKSINTEQGQMAGCTVNIAPESEYSKPRPTIIKASD